MSPEIDLEESGSPLQEAIDSIIQLFDHPKTLELIYESENGQKWSKIEANYGTSSAIYELRFDPEDDDSEPEIIALDD